MSTHADVGFEEGRRTADTGPRDGVEDKVVGCADDGDEDGERVEETDEPQMTRQVLGMRTRPTSGRYKLLRPWVAASGSEPIVRPIMRL